MKASYKAALLSAFIFPGIGHLYLKRYLRGLVILSLEFTGLGYMIWWAIVVTFNRLDEALDKMQGGIMGTINPQELSDIIGLKMLTTDPYYNAVCYVVICFWIFAIIDAYRIGKQKEFQGLETHFISPNNLVWSLDVFSPRSPFAHNLVEVHQSGDGTQTDYQTVRSIFDPSEPRMFDKSIPPVELWLRPDSNKLRMLDESVPLEPWPRLDSNESRMFDEPVPSEEVWEDVSRFSRVFISSGW
jgi:TM2 domain-containing membrane protein YozV